MMFPVSGSILLLMFLYFIQGLPYGLQAQFLPVYLRSKGVNLTDIGLLKIMYAPWLCKFLWGPLVDQFSTKRKWLLISVLCLGITCIFGALFPPEYLIPVTIVLFFLNLFASIQDVAVDAIAIRLLTSEELGQGNTVQVVGYKLGSIFGGGILASFVHVIGWLGLFLVLAVLYVEAGMFIYVSPSLRYLDTLHQPANGDDSNKNSGSQNDYDASCNMHRHKQSMQHTCEHSHAHHSQQAGQSCARNTCVQHSDPDGQEEKQNLCTASDSHICKQPDGIISATETHESYAPKFHSTFRRVLDVPGTRWMMVFLFIFKLGEQGALNMLPLFFLDRKVDSSDVTFWTGIVGQGVSIFGSVLGGWFVTAFRKIPLDFLLQQLCLLRLLPAGAQLLLVVVWDMGIIQREVLFYIAILTLLVLLLLSGIITTVTFTFMMQCSRSANADIQATHYTTLATVEVLGKLSFTAACGWLADIFGYRFLFLSFATLSVTVLPLLKACPEEIASSEPGCYSAAEIEITETKDKDE